MSKKTVKFNESGIDRLPNDKLVVYKILTPGAKVQIEQMSTIQEAMDKERNIIARSKPKHNEQGE